MSNNINVIGYKQIDKTNNREVAVNSTPEEPGIQNADAGRTLNRYCVTGGKTKRRVWETSEEMDCIANKTASGILGRPAKIGVIISHSPGEDKNSPMGLFFGDIVKGIESAFTELAEFQVEKKIYFAKYNSAKKEYERTIIDMAESGCDGIAILPSAIEIGFENIIEKVKALGVVVGTVISDFPNSARDFSVRNNGVIAGKMAAQLLHWLAGEAPVAMVTGFRDNIVHSETIRGFKTYLEKTPMNFVGIYEHRDDPDIAYYLASRMMKEKPYIKGIYFGTANSVTFCKRLEEIGRLNGMKIVASDLSPEIAQYIRNGAMDATIFQNPYAQGRMLILKMYQYIAKMQKTDREVYYLNPQPVFASNLEVFYNDEHK